MPAANVTLTNLGTDKRHTMQTDGFGNYQFVNLVPGQYKAKKILDTSPRKSP